MKSKSNNRNERDTQPIKDVLDRAGVNYKSVRPYKFKDHHGEHTLDIYAVCLMEEFNPQVLAEQLEDHGLRLFGFHDADARCILMQDMAWIVKAL